MDIVRSGTFMNYWDTLEFEGRVLRCSSSCLFFCKGVCAPAQERRNYCVQIRGRVLSRVNAASWVSRDSAPSFVNMGSEETCLDMHLHTSQNPIDHDHVKKVFRTIFVTKMTKVHFHQKVYSILFFSFGKDFLREAQIEHRRWGY